MSEGWTIVVPAIHVVIVFPHVGHAVQYRMWLMIISRCLLIAAMLTSEYVSSPLFVCVHVAVEHRLRQCRVALVRKCLLGNHVLNREREVHRISHANLRSSIAGGPYIDSSSWLIVAVRSRIACGT
jgi:hypothetical protein